MSVIVVGGGWAGLAAAVKLAERNIPVTVLESAKQLGGRARCVSFNDDSVDNGQHLMVGAYHEMLGLLGIMGVSEEEAFVRLPLDLEMTSPKGSPMHLRTAPLPAPLNLLAGLAGNPTLTYRERLSALGFCLRLAASRFRLKQDISVEALLIRHRQQGRLKTHLWGPLCIAIMNTPPHEASARVFLRVLRDTFSRRRDDSDLLIPKQNLCRILPHPAMHYVERRGGSVRLRHRVTGLDIRDGRVHGVMVGENTLAADHVIVATPTAAAYRLAASHSELEHSARSLAAFDNEPIATVYLRYSPEARLATPMLGMVDTHSQWVFDRAVVGQPGIMAVVISSRGAHSALDREALAAKVEEELARTFPQWGPAQEHLVIEEKRATFACTVGIEDRRPRNETPVRGLWLAGDYTNTGYPATLEGAIISGVRAAQGVVREYRPR